VAAFSGACGQSQAGAAVIRGDGTGGHLPKTEALDGAFCLEMLEEALLLGTPEIFNTDRGVQFTAEAWKDRWYERKLG